jgi:hypothetical protein
MDYAHEPFPNVAARPRHFGLALDRLVRGALIFGLVGLGLGGVLVPLFSTPFSSGWQWACAGAGSLAGAVGAPLWRGRHSV